jgi:hypothetical protein
MNNYLYTSSNFYRPSFITKNKPEIKKTSFQKIEESLNIKTALKNKLSQSKKSDFTNKKTLLPIEIIMDSDEKAKSIYIINIKEKLFNDYIKKFINKIDKINDKTLNQINKNIEKVIFCKNEIEESSKRIKLLNIKIKEMNNEIDDITSKLKIKNDKINDLQNEFSIYDKIKPVFEELISSFPGKDVKKLIINLKNCKDDNISKIEKIDILTKQIDNLKIEYTKNSIKQQSGKDNILQKIKEQQLDIEFKNEGYKRKIMDLENEIQLYKNYQKDNIRKNNLLYQLFLEIIPKIQKEKYKEFCNNYGSDPKKKEEFDAKVFNEKKFNDLIKISFLKNITHTKGSIQLRQIIAYSNMMVRKYLEKKENLRYDPSNIFKELKNLIDKKEIEIHKKGNMIQKLKYEQVKNKQKIKHLLNEEKMSKIKLNNFIDKIILNYATIKH